MSSYRPGTSSTNLGGIQLRAILIASALLAVLPVCAQYPGQVTKTGKDTPELRAIAVLEFTGEPGKPNRSRLVPVAVLDAGQLQDGAIYLARPEPLSLAGEVEYELEQNGKPIGLYDIRNASQEQGSWVGYGTWRPLPVAKPRPAKQQLARIDENDAQSDEPVLHRKHHVDERPGAGSGSSGSGGNSGSSGQAQDTDPVSDPDRPTLHKSASGSDASTTANTTGASSTQASSTDSDSDRPTLHRSPSSDSGSTNSTASTGSTSSPSQTSSSDAPTLHRRDSTSSDSTANDSDSGSASSNDPDRPVLHKSRQVRQEGSGQSESVEAADPDRPTLKRGKSGGPTLEVVPSLIGTPPDVQQAVAVSDARAHPVHPWTYSWSTPDDEAKMKSSMEDIARAALGINPPVPPPAPKRTTTTRRSAKPKPPPAAPAPLVGEQFHVFELAYGSGATMVLSAHTDGPLTAQKFVTLIAQPDLYGNVLVLLKNVTDASHLDDTPRMRLVDAVDAMADNRGELLFELRGATQRQFALYRVLRGQAEKLFVTGGEDAGVE